MYKKWDDLSQAQQQALTEAYLASSQGAWEFFTPIQGTSEAFEVCNVLCYEGYLEPGIPGDPMIPRYKLTAAGLMAYKNGNPDENPFEHLFQVADAVRAAKEQEQEEAKAKEQRLRSMQADLMNKWLETIMQALGLPSRLVAQNKVIYQDFTFSVSIKDASSGHMVNYDEYYPLTFSGSGRKIVHSLENAITDTPMRCYLLIQSNLDIMYRESRADNWQKVIAEHQASVYIPDVIYLSSTAFKAEVANAIQFLQTEIAEAPARYDAGLAYLKEQHEAAERREARLKADREAEKKQRAIQEAEYQAWIDEQEAQSKARVEAAKRLEAEVAARFEVSAEAFSYLIETLADRIKEILSEEGYI